MKSFGGFRCLSLVGAACLVACGTDARAGFVIDPFNSPPTGQISSDAFADGVTVRNSLGGEPVLGGSRELFVTKTGQRGLGDQTVKASVNEMGTQIFNFDQYSSTARGIAQLVYDGAADGVLSPKGFATSVDLTDGGTNLGFAFQNLKVTGSGLLLTVNLFNKTTGAMFSSGPQLLMNGDSGELFLPFASFIGDGGIATVTDVGAIEIVIDGSGIIAAGSDLKFSLFSGSPGPTPVPEPGSLALLACGTLLTGGFGVRRLRRN